MLNKLHHTFLNINLLTNLVDEFNFYSFDDKLITLEVRQNRYTKIYIFKNIYGHELYWTDDAIEAFQVKNNASVYTYDEIKQWGSYTRFFKFNFAPSEQIAQNDTPMVRCANCDTLTPHYELKTRYGLYGSISTCSPCDTELEND